MKRLIYIAVLALVVFSCKKEPLPNLPKETGPYYSVNGYLNNELIHLNVGQEGIHISQGVETKNGIETYYGQILSPSEDLLIRVEITRPEVTVTTTGLTAIQENSLSYLVHQPGCLTPKFGNNISQSNYLLIKNSEGVFEPVSQIEFDEYGIYDVTLKFTDVGQNSFQVPVQYGYKPVVLNPEFSTFPLGDSMTFAAINQTGTHEWYIDGGMVNTEVEFNHQLPIGIHKVEHKITDSHGNKATYTTLVRITDYVYDWQLSMPGCTGPVYESNYGKVSVSVLTNGKEYRSDRSVNNLQKNFNVGNIQYVGNSAGTPIRAVFDFSFDAHLLDETGTESLSLEGMTGTFNVGLQ